MRRRLVPACFFFGAFFAFVPSANASPLSYVSDLISTSAPAAGATHTIQFTLVRAIPSSGSITIVPEGAFGLPAGFNESDIALLVATSGPYTARTLAPSPGPSEDGAAVVTGSSPSITFTLNTTEGMVAGTAVRIVLASTTAPTYDPVNPASTGSYRIRIYTADGVGAPLDYGTAMIAVVSPVIVSAAPAQYAPKRSNGEPSGSVAAGNSVIELSLTTDELATCRYATSTGITYDAMPYTFTPNVGDVFYTDLSGFQNNTAYAFYVRCISTQGLVNTDDYEISFTLGPTPISNTSVASNSSGGGISVGPYPYGSSVLYLGTVELIGSTSPEGSVTVLQDGVVAATALAGSDGSFRAIVANLERGMYTFGLYTTDTIGRKTAADSEALNVTQGSTNTISGILLPPSISLSAGTAPLGSDVTVSGQALLGAQIEISVSGTTGTARTYSATSSPPVGAWSLTIPGSDLAEGTYQIKARAIQSADSISNFSTPLQLNVGTGSAPSCGSSTDLNGDKKVNLIDFSIFLTHWGTSDTQGDFNCDGTVNLADFSIMLFNWTG